MSWIVDTSTPSNLAPALASALDTINGLSAHPMEAARELFDPLLPMVIGRAPGRLDLMGGIADYSGSLVLQLPIREATFAALQRCSSDCSSGNLSERKLTIISLTDESDIGRDETNAFFQMDLADFEEGGRPVSYADAREYFQRHSETSWAAYIAGAFLVLMREEGAHFDEGARLLIQSSVPEGKGVSSSAAVEVATMKAVAEAYGLEIEPRRMGILCQMVENLVVGAPCGVMDQMTACCGEENRLLALLCQPAEILPSVQLPPELAVWGIDSGIRHAVSGADYGSVRIGTFMGYRMILDLAGIADKTCVVGEVNDSAWGGYLANMTPSEFEQLYRQKLPATIKGDDFLSQYGDTTDTVTRVEPSRIYAVRQPTAHPIYEHFRVNTFANLLKGDPIENGPLLGECMYQSHASYSACGLGSDGTDQLVALAREIGPAGGIFGAKITGGGSGGTVAILGQADANNSIREIAEAYASSTGEAPYLFAGSSSGAAAFMAHPRTS